MWVWQMKKKKWGKKMFLNSTIQKEKGGKKCKVEIEDIKSLKWEDIEIERQKERAEKRRQVNLEDVSVLQKTNKQNNT